MINHTLHHFITKFDEIITKCNRCFSIKCDKKLLLNSTGILLQNVTVVTKCNGFITYVKVITKCKVYYKMRWYNNQ